MGMIISGKNGSRWQSKEEGEQNSDQISFCWKTPEKKCPFLHRSRGEQKQKQGERKEMKKGITRTKEKRVEKQS